MEYEYVENIAQELRIRREELDNFARELGIIMLQMGVPPSGARVAAAVTHPDAERLRAYCAEKRQNSELTARVAVQRSSQGSAVRRSGT